MLKKFLKPETCAECRICCVYDDSDVWDAPGFTQEEFERNNIEGRFSYRQAENGLYYLNMEKDGEGIYTCPCLSSHGCVLGKDKPFRCSLWPLYLVKTDNGTGIALSPVCPQVRKLKNDEIFEGIKDILPQLLDTVMQDPSLLENFSPEYRMVALPDENGVYHCLPDEAAG